MKGRLLILAGALAGCVLAWGADSKDTLQRARADYQQAVSAHGTGSPEARSARQNLRTARQTFHTERREHTQRRRAPPR